MTAKDILVIVIIPLALAELGPWCGWFAAKLIPKAAKLRYGNTERSIVRSEEWSGHLNHIPGQLSKLGYAACQFLAGSVIVTKRKTRSSVVITKRKVRNIAPGDSVQESLKVPIGLTVNGDQAALMIFQTHQEMMNSIQDTLTVLSVENLEKDQAQGAAAHKIASSFISEITQLQGFGSYSKVLEVGRRWIRLLREATRLHSNDLGHS